jgi:hypothetical protein
METNEIVFEKFYLTLEDTAKENKMDLGSDSKDSSKVVQEIAEVINSVCPGAVKEIAKYKESKIELKDLEDAILKMPKEKYSLLNHPPKELAETFYRVFNSKEYNGKVDIKYFDQFISDCKSDYNLNHTNGRKGLGNDFETFAEHLDEIRLVRVSKK